MHYIYHLISITVILSCLLYNCFWLIVCIIVFVLCVLLSYVYLLYCVCIAVFTFDAGLLARSQYSEGPATGHLDRGILLFPVSTTYKQMLRWFPTFQVATTCFSCSPPDLNLVVTNFVLADKHDRRKVSLFAIWRTRLKTGIPPSHPPPHPPPKIPSSFRLILYIIMSVITKYTMDRTIYERVIFNLSEHFLATLE